MTTYQFTEDEIAILNNLFDVCEFTITNVARVQLVQMLYTDDILLTSTDSRLSNITFTSETIYRNLKYYIDNIKNSPLFGVNDNTLYRLSAQALRNGLPQTNTIKKLIRHQLTQSTSTPDYQLSSREKENYESKCFILESPFLITEKIHYLDMFDVNHEIQTFADYWSNINPNDRLEDIIPLTMTSYVKLLSEFKELNAANDQKANDLKLAILMEIHQALDKHIEIVNRSLDEAMAQIKTAWSNIIPNNKPTNTSLESDISPFQADINYVVAFWLTFEEQFKGDIIPHYFLYELFEAWFTDNHPTITRIDRKTFLDQLQYYLNAKHRSFRFETDAITITTSTTPAEPCATQYHLPTYMTITAPRRITGYVIREQFRPRSSKSYD